MFSSSFPSKVYEAWIFLIRFSSQLHHVAFDRLKSHTHFLTQQPIRSVSLCFFILNFAITRSIRVVERLALPTSDHGVAGSNPAGGEILPEPKRRFTAQSLSCSPFHRLEMTEILLKGRKTLTHRSSIHRDSKRSYQRKVLFQTQYLT